MRCASTNAMKSCGVKRARADLAKCGLAERKLSGAVLRLVKVAAAAAGDEDLLAGTLGALEDEDAAPAASRLDGTHEAGGTGAEDEDVDFGHWQCGPRLRRTGVEGWIRIASMISPWAGCQRMITG